MCLFIPLIMFLYSNLQTIIKLFQTLLIPSTIVCVIMVTFNVSDHICRHSYGNLSSHFPFYLEIPQNITDRMNYIQTNLIYLNTTLKF